MPDGTVRRMGSDGGGWTTVVVQVEAADAELVSDRLWSLGAAGIEERQTPGDSMQLLAGFETAGAAADAVDAIRDAGLGSPHRHPVVDDGLDTWRELAGPVEAGPFLLVPAWVDPPPVDPGSSKRRVLRLDPGRSFGSGSHPTTRLVVAALAPLAGAGTRVLDVGCGSGVLAVAAAMLGATVEAIDVDEGAPAVTHANAVMNGVEERVHGSTRPLAEVAASEPPFDLVLANLLAPVIAELAPDMVAATAPTGTLVVSGLLADRWRASAQHLRPLEVSAVSEEDGWVALVMRRR
jgi:ribosomal protein L11 methyltransferase